MTDDPLPVRILGLRAEIAELGAAARQLHRAGLDNATAQLLLLRKRDELERLMKRGRGRDPHGLGA